MKELSTFSYFLAALTAAVLMFDLLPPDEIPSTTGMIIITVLLFSAGRLFDFFHYTGQQRGYDRRAAEVFARLQSGLDADASSKGKSGDKDYVLYLRPFSTTASLVAINPLKRWLPILPTYYSRRETVEFESLLAESLAPDYDFLALGKPGEHIGAARIRISDEDWRSAFFTLCARARWILMIPSHEGETGWEVAQLREKDYLDKTFFIMPPILHSSAADSNAYWEGVRNGLQESGLQLPGFTHAGQLFRLNTEGRPCQSRNLPQLKPALLRKCLRGMFR